MDLYKVVIHTPSNESAFRNEAISAEDLRAIYKLNTIQYRLTLVAVVDRDELRIGVSICNTKYDNFDKKIGTTNATFRALTKPTYLGNHSVMPSKREVLNKMYDVHREVAMNLEQTKKIVNG
jgi:hypothetical protein